MKRYTYFSKKQKKASRKIMAQRNSGFYLTGETWEQTMLKNSGKGNVFANMLLASLFRKAGM